MFCTTEGKVRFTFEIVLKPSALWGLNSFVMEKLQQVPVYLFQESRYVSAQREIQALKT